MQNLMRHLIARLRDRLTSSAPTSANRPQRPPLPPRRPESPLDGEATLLVRPYLLAHERQEARREGAFLREMAVVS